MKITPYPKNPTCSKILLSKGKTNFVYFYYRSKDGKRKMVKYSEGLNDPNLTERKFNSRVSEYQEALGELLKTQYFDGEKFIDTTEKISTTVIELMDEFVNSREQLVGENTTKNYENGLNFFKEYLKEIDQQDLLITELDTNKISYYIKYMLTFEKEFKDGTRKKLAISTVRQYKEYLNIFINWVKKTKKLIKDNPMEDIDVGTVLKYSPTKKHKVYKIDEWQEIINYFNNDNTQPVLTVFLFIYYTHLRPQEILRLQMKDIDLSRKYLTPTGFKLKNRRERDIPIDQPLYDYLISLNLDFSTPENLLIADGRPDKGIKHNGTIPYTVTRLNSLFHTAKKKLGLGEGYTIYGAKHSASVHEYLYEDMTKEQIRVKSGHATIKQTEVYMKGLDELINVPDFKERKLKFEI